MCVCVLVLSVMFQQYNVFCSCIALLVSGCLVSVCECVSEPQTAFVFVFVFVCLCL